MSRKKKKIRDQKSIIIKKKPETPYLLYFLAFALPAYAVFRVMGLYESGLDVFEKAKDPSFLFSGKYLVISKGTVGVGLSIGLFALAALSTYLGKQRMTIQNDIYGSAEWGSPEDSFPFRAGNGKSPFHNMLMTNTDWFERKNGANRNVILIGRPGTGKSRYFFKPNILNAEGSIFITDPKGEILRDCGHSLLVKGYTIKVLNLENKAEGNHYNPFQYILMKSADEARKGGYSDEEIREGVAQEDDVMSLINCIFKNTKGDVDNTTGDPFWEKSEMLFDQSIFYYILYKRNSGLPRNFSSVLSLIAEANPDENGNSKLKVRFDEWEAEEKERLGLGENEELTLDPRCNIGIKQWHLFMNAAQSPKTMATIILSASARLGPLNIEEVSNMVSDDDMELYRAGKAGSEGKIAYFIVTNPGDMTFNFLASVFYSQVFKILDSNAKANGGSLATPCDLYMDEWAQLGEIPRFVNQLAYVRGLNVGIVVGLQSLDQLKEKYKDSWQTALDCCDYILFLGSNSKETMEYISAMLGKRTYDVDSGSRTYAKSGSSSQSWQKAGRELAQIDELRKMKKGKCILLATGLKPFYSDVYDLTKHPCYKDIYEPWNSEDKRNAAKRYDHYAMAIKPQEKAKKLQKMFRSCGLDVDMVRDSSGGVEFIV